ncbi:hypothetical protein [Rhodococcus sp. X156]|uniref:hypothetical protein n=1 Tax=Rhodococcus sp. X156 TaxID=2499145 RepID=UPI000FDCD547|nr:hypothetical protein [Rhodococcus sp. X156]
MSEKTVLRGTVVLASGVLAAAVLAGCGSDTSSLDGEGPTSALPATTQDAATATAAPSPDASSTTAGVPTPTAAGEATPGAPATGGSTGTAAPGAAPGPGGTGPGGAGSARTGSPAAPAAPPASGQAVSAYANQVCGAVTPLYSLKERYQNPDLSGITNGQQAKDLAVRILGEAVAQGNASLSAVSSLGPAPDAQSAAGIAGFAQALRAGVGSAQTYLGQARAVDPNNPLALVSLAQQARQQVQTTASSGVASLRSGSSPAMLSALRASPGCSALGL